MDHRKREMTCRPEHSLWSSHGVYIFIRQGRTHSDFSLYLILQNIQQTPRISKCPMYWVINLVLFSFLWEQFDPYLRNNLPMNENFIST